MQLMLWCAAILYLRILGLDDVGLDDVGLMPAMDNECRIPYSCFLLPPFVVCSLQSGCLSTDIIRDTAHCADKAGSSSSSWTGMIGSCASCCEPLTANVAANKSHLDQHVQEY